MGRQEVGRTLGLDKRTIRRMEERRELVPTLIEDGANWYDRAMIHQLALEREKLALEQEKLALEQEKLALERKTKPRKSGEYRRPAPSESKRPAPSEEGRGSEVEDGEYRPELRGRAAVRPTVHRARPAVAPPSPAPPKVTVTKITSSASPPKMTPSPPKVTTPPASPQPSPVPSVNGPRRAPKGEIEYPAEWFSDDYKTLEEIEAEQRAQEALRSRAQESERDPDDDRDESEPASPPSKRSEADISISSEDDDDDELAG